MQQGWAGLEDLVEADVGDARAAASQLQPPEAAARDRHAPQPGVRDGRAAAQRHPLHRRLGTRPADERKLTFYLR